jgi:hypothetical protein
MPANDRDLPDPPHPTAHLLLPVRPPKRLPHRIVGDLERRVIELGLIGEERPQILVVVVVETDEDARCDPSSMAEFPAMGLHSLPPSRGCEPHLADVAERSIASPL